MQTANERDLVEAAQKDPQQFGILFDLHYKTIFAYIFRRLADADLARDIASETFLKAFLKIGSYKYIGVPFSAWLYRIAGNEINLYFRKQKYQPESLQQLREYYEFEPANSESWEEEKERIEKEFSDHQDFEKVQLHLKTLSVKYQEVIALRYFEGKNIREIADILNKQEGTVKSLLSRGLEKLRQLF